MPGKMRYLIDTDELAAHVLPAFKSPHCLQKGHCSAPLNTGPLLSGGNDLWAVGAMSDSQVPLLSTFGPALKGHGACELTEGEGPPLPCAMGLDASCLWKRS